jgi:hypothetical protein
MLKTSWMLNLAATMSVSLISCAIDAPSQTQTPATQHEQSIGQPVIGVAGLYAQDPPGNVAEELRQSLTQEMRRTIEQTEGALLDPAKYDLLDLSIMMNCKVAESECLFNISGFLQRSRGTKEYLTSVIYGAVDRVSDSYRLDLWKVDFATHHIRSWSRTADESELSKAASDGVFELLR